MSINIPITNRLSQKQLLDIIEEMRQEIVRLKSITVGEGLQLTNTSAGIGISLTNTGNELNNASMPKNIKFALIGVRWDDEDDNVPLIYSLDTKKIVASKLILNIPAEYIDSVDYDVAVAEPCSAE